MKLLDKITPLEVNFSQWYIDVVTKGNLIAYGSTKGAMFYKPIAYGIWQNIQNAMNIILQDLGVQNVYLPLLIPLSQIEREKAHVDGFAPELATVTRVGEEILKEPLVIRPTSEVLFGELFANEVHSYNDLPLRFNQWANVVRWEKTTNPFLRNREFLWQEGHTAHASSTEAEDTALNMIKVYAQFCADYLALPVFVGQKTDHEKFAGAVVTHTIEARMKDGRALQAGTSHYLGQNFAKAFKVSFKNKANEDELIYQTSWGLSTRLIGAIIMSHGDNRGVVIPPRIALYQIDVIEFFANKDQRVASAAQAIVQALKTNALRVRHDQSAKMPGYKVSQSEIEGTPLRIEIGPRDIVNDEVSIVRRDTLEKISVKVTQVVATVKALLLAMHNDLFAAAQQRLNENIVEATTYDELKALIEARKFVIMPFAGDGVAEKQIKLETGASTRFIFEHEAKMERACFWTKQPTRRLVVFARAY